MKIKKLIQKSAFVNSFKLDKKFLHVLLLDLFFMILILSLIAIYAFTLRSNMDAMKEYDDTAKRVGEMMAGNLQMDDLLAQDMTLVTNVLKLFFLKMAIISLVFLIIMITAGVIIKTWGWSKILNKKLLNKKICLKLSLLIFIWNLIWILALFIIAFTLKFSLHATSMIAAVELLLYIYFSLILYPVFFRDKGVFKTIKKTFVLGISKFYLFLQSFSAMLLILIIISFIVGGIALIPSPISFMIIILLCLIYLVWMKFYMNLVIKKIY